MFTMRARLLALLMASALGGLALSAKPNFQGDWKMAAAKSEFGQFPAPSSMTQKVTHEDPVLKASTKMSTDNGDMEFESNYSTDGKETKNSFGPNEMKSTARWEGDLLVVDTKGQFGDTEVKILDKWELSADGKTLTVNRHFSSAMGEMDQKIVFEKQ
jgi:hypothetical protein